MYFSNSNRYFTKTVEGLLGAALHTEAYLWKITPDRVAG